jgi:hypothetical protein
MDPLNCIIVLQLPPPGHRPSHTDQGWYWHAGTPPFSTPGDLSTQIADATKMARQAATATAQAIAEAQPGIRAAVWRDWGPGTLRNLEQFYNIPTVGYGSGPWGVAPWGA